MRFRLKRWLVVLGCGVGVAGCDGEPVDASGSDIATSGFGESSGSEGDDSADSVGEDDDDGADDGPATLPDAGTKPWCGDGVLDEGEACDGEDFGGRSCDDEGADGGSLRCTDDCQIDTCGCTWEDGGGDCPPDTPPVCGNGIQESGESCDGTDIPSWDFDPCEAELGNGFYGGVGCTADCTLDTSTCGWCGDGVWQEWEEECDGDEIGDFTCEEAIHVPALGSPTCDKSCELIFDNCEPSCGNGELDPGESCDGEALGEQTCADVGAVGGTMGCTEDCTFDPGECDYCGNGVLDPGEVCDGDAFVESQCSAVSAFASGLLACADTCTYDLSTCEVPGGTLVISEVLPVAVPDPLFPQGEWLELHNPGDGTVSLDDCTLSGLVPFETQPFEPGAVIEAGDYVTFGHGTPEDLGFTPDYSLAEASSFLNVGDLIRIECGGTLVDEVEYDDAKPWPPLTAGRSIEVSAAGLDSFNNDAAESWCGASNEYAPGFSGTPGGASDCPVAD